MKTGFGFTLLENSQEVYNYLKKKKVSRKITRLQVHHTYLPNYTTWVNTDLQIYKNNAELMRCNSLDSYGEKVWHCKDSNNHYIAQHFTIFPNGKIATGRDLNSTPIGIKGWNTNAICVEIYGDFEKGKDMINPSQKSAIITLYALLCIKFNLSPTSNVIRPHAWFTASGNYIGDYNKTKSAKTCPGTNFMNFGNSKESFEKNFYPLIKKEMQKWTNEKSPTTTKMVKNISPHHINIRNSASWNSNIIATLSPGDSLTYISGPISATGGSTKMYRCKNNAYITASPTFTKIINT